MTTTVASTYPVAFEAAAPVKQNRWTVFFRIILAIPHIIIVRFLDYAAVAVAFITWFAILFTGRCPEGLFKFNLGVTRWQARLWAYVFLLTDHYPPFSLDPDPSYPITFDAVPALEGRNRLTTFFRLFMLIPHVIVLAFLVIAAVVVWIIAWFAALFTGAVPGGMHGFLTGFSRWSNRVRAYALLLTDAYPPFSLS